MTDGTADQLQVAFPATSAFTRIGRVAVVGLALRLGIDVSTVEKLRAAVDDAVSALQGAGRISASATWTPDELTITLGNPQARIADVGGLSNRLAELVGRASVDQTAISLTLETRGA
jgi:hypothetical protein